MSCVGFFVWAGTAKESFNDPWADGSVGTPVAATAVDGCAEIIVDGEHGLLVPSMDPGALAAAVGRLLDHPALATKVVDAAATRVQAWDRRTMLAQIADLYDEVLARRGGPRG